MVLDSTEGGSTFFIFDSVMFLVFLDREKVEKGMCSLNFVLWSVSPHPNHPFVFPNSPNNHHYQQAATKMLYCIRVLVNFCYGIYKNALVNFLY